MRLGLASVTDAVDGVPLQREGDGDYVRPVLGVDGGKTRDPGGREPLAPLVAGHTSPVNCAIAQFTGRVTARAVSPTCPEPAAHNPVTFALQGTSR